MRLSVRRLEFRAFVFVRIVSPKRDKFQQAFHSATVEMARALSTLHASPFPLSLFLSGFRRFLKKERRCQRQQTCLLLLAVSPTDTWQYRLEADRVRSLELAGALRAQGHYLAKDVSRVRFLHFSVSTPSAMQLTSIVLAQPLLNAFVPFTVNLPSVAGVSQYFHRRLC